MKIRLNLNNRMLIEKSKLIIESLYFKYNYDKKFVVIIQQ